MVFSFSVWVRMGEKEATEFFVGERHCTSKIFTVAVETTVKEEKAIACHVLQSLSSLQDQFDSSC